MVYHVKIGVILKPKRKKQPARNMNLFGFVLNIAKRNHSNPNVGSSFFKDAERELPKIARRAEVLFLERAQMIR